MDHSPPVYREMPLNPVDINMPFGRLRALCPQGTIRAQSARAIIKTLLLKKPRNCVSLRDIDLLAARTLYNTAHSPLFRLPDSLLVKIMGDLDWLDILCLRHTCRIFLRLFSRDEFSHLHDGSGYHNASIHFFSNQTMLWKAPTLSSYDRMLWESMKGRLISDIYDSHACKQTYRGFHNIYMHCNACEVDHPTTLFSAPERKFEQSGHRICAAHQGHVRLCKHKIVKWSTVLASLPGGRINNNYRRGVPNSDVVGNGSSALPFSIEPDLRIVCTHSSHIPDHHCSQSQNCHVTTGSTDNVAGGSTSTPAESGPPPAYERFATNDHPEFPSFVVHDMMVSGTKHKVVTWSYTAHIDLTGLGDPNNNDAITAQTFRDCVHKLRNDRHSPAQYIAPEDYPGILHELRCVDPNRCGCLVYPGFERGAAQTAQGPDMICRDHEVVRKLYTRVNDWDNIRIRLESCDCQNDGDTTRCLKIIYTRTFRLQGYYVDPAPDWRPGQYRGNRRSALRIHLHLQDSFRAKSVPYGWYQALDPHSYGICRDVGPSPPTWCRNRRCRLHPSFLRNYIYKQEMNSDCTYGCENSHWGAGIRNTYCFEIPLKEQWGGWKTLKLRGIHNLRVLNRQLMNG